MRFQGHRQRPAPARPTSCEVRPLQGEPLPDRKIAFQSHYASVQDCRCAPVQVCRCTARKKSASAADQAVEARREPPSLNLQSHHFGQVHLTRRGSHQYHCLNQTDREVNVMTTPETLLPEISDLVQIELAKYLSEAFPIAEVTSQFLPGANGEDYLRTTVILEDGHPNWTHTSSTNSRCTLTRSARNGASTAPPSSTLTEARSRFDHAGHSTAGANRLETTPSHRPGNPDSPAASHST